MRTLLSRGVYLGPFVGRQLCMDRWSSDEFRNDFRCQLAMPRLSEEIGDFGGSRKRVNMSMVFHTAWGAAHTGSKVLRNSNGTDGAVHSSQCSIVRRLA